MKIYRLIIVLGLFLALTPVAGAADFVLVVNLSLIHI
jgi:hypothetical protein